MNLDKHLLEQGLLPSTRSKYASILAASGRDPAAWLRDKLSVRRPIGTVLPLRAAVKHYLIAQGYDEDSIAALLPKDKNALIVAYCGNEYCNAYQAAASAAVALGYTNVKHLSAGISGWLQASQPTEK
jgi:rhodanese-related sulfurtransferase